MFQSAFSGINPTHDTSFVQNVFVDLLGYGNLSRAANNFGGHFLIVFLNNRVHIRFQTNKLLNNASTHFILEFQGSPFVFGGTKKMIRRIV